MILQRIRIIVGDTGFEPGTSAPEVWCATNEPPHLQVSQHISIISLLCTQLPGIWIFLEQVARFTGTGAPDGGQVVLKWMKDDLLVRFYVLKVDTMTLRS